MDAFLNEVHKKKVNDAIKQRNQEKKLQAQDLNSVTQPCNSAISEASATNIPESSNSDNNEIISQDKAGKIHKKTGVDHKKDTLQDSLRKKTQRAEKVYKFFEQVDINKIRYIKFYSATFILELTNEQIQKI
ncbi:2445_t:CDS:2 [Ambispora gerdemannii]|uniref:2445_t:CDS:1 n=1 Tax=Ambispora gerdemannii TaxID=144530 RepID=A0A9N9GF85_9GLOM|nr:2445_t:CDS:2 [Ambispora gerdemannii]